MSIKDELIRAYRRYGFVLARKTANDDVLVFTLKTGYFDNAEIVKINENASTESIFKEFSAAGYACTVRTSKSAELVEAELFKGFFSVDATRERLSDEYKRFTSALVKHYGESAQYEYIKAPYHINGNIGLYSPPDEVVSRIDDERPILFLIEAAAGFGKTCTAQEIAKLLINGTSKLPLYAELSRNRQARIFRYILLDEIDRTFPLLSSTLVQSEIKNGRISVILDGFDELLRKNEDGDSFDNKEPMLETVSELLTGKAKVVITTRRTVLFDGDEFHQWLERHVNDFSVIRIRIQEPRVNDWLSHDRIQILKDAGLNIEAMANPVLLSYLRCINDPEFNKLSCTPESVVQSYFTYMLDRERERQDLRMTIADQSEILRIIAGDMIANGYTAEEREYIIRLIIEKCTVEIEAARSQYPATDKPSREEIANKLASHALLDRSIAESTKIGFVNEFSLGNYVAENIVIDAEWLGDDLRFIEPAVKAYLPRTVASKLKLYHGLEGSLPYLDLASKIQIAADLTGILPDDLENGSVDQVELSGLNVGSPKLVSFQFNETIFKDCIFIRSGLDNVTFLHCKFFDCRVTEDDFAGAVYALGCTSSPEITGMLENSSNNYRAGPAENRERLVERSILKRFWPVGESIEHRPSRPIYKPLKHLCQSLDEFDTVEVYRGIERLTKSGVLNYMNRSNLITLNFEKLSIVHDIFEDVP